MKASVSISHGTISIIHEGILYNKMAAIHDISSNTLRIMDGHAKRVPKILNVLRSAKVEYGIELKPLKIEYW